MMKWTEMIVAILQTEYQVWKDETLCNYMLKKKEKKKRMEFNLARSQ